MILDLTLSHDHDSRLDPIACDPIACTIALSHVTLSHVKSISAREFFRIYPEIKRRYFWGGKLWTQSYFVETIGNANEEVIRQYVQNQLTEYEKKESKSKQIDQF